VQAKYILAAVIVLAGFAIMSWFRARNLSARTHPAAQQISQSDLKEGEQHVYGLLREVQGHAILTESFIREDGDVRVQLTLDTAKTTVASLNINLSSLARKQKENGLSDGAVKRGFTF